MSMHLEKAWLSTTGKKKGKVKFRNAAEAQRARQLEESWRELQNKWKPDPSLKKKQNSVTQLKTQPPLWRGANDPKIPSLATTWTPCTKAPEKVYTGNSVLGITVMHKSCLQPVFSQQDAIDAAKMRR